MTLSDLVKSEKLLETLSGMGSSRNSTHIIYVANCNDLMVIAISRLGYHWL